MARLNANTNPSPHNAAVNGKPPSSIPIEGILVSMTGNHLVMMSPDGSRYPLSVSKDVKVTLDNVICDSVELKNGRRIRVTRQQDNLSLVTSIETLGHNTEFPP